MPEPVFLLLLMVMTGLGVWMFLGQVHGQSLRLPRLRLPHLRLPGPPRRRRPKRTRERTVHEEYALGEEDAGRFAPDRSPFSAQPHVEPVRTALQPGPADEDEGDEDEYEEDYTLASQVDFFAADRDEGASGPLRQVSLASPAGLDPDRPSPDAEVAQPGASPVFEVTAAPEPDPNDLMSFFEKPAATTQLPETLRESLNAVSAVELLTEARQLRALLQGHKDPA